jgi:predicted PurR-regulated permease PerM
MKPAVMPVPSQSNVTRTFLVILILAILVAGSTWTLLPFRSSTLWATTIVVATWPLLRRVQDKVGGSRSIAATLMTVSMLVIFIVPFGLAVAVVLNAAVEGVEIVRAVTRDGLPDPPSWLASIPLFGTQATARWQALSAGGPDAVAEALRPFLLSTANFAMAVTGGFGRMALHILLTVILVAALYSRGETAARGVIMFARRIGKDSGERTVRLAGEAVRGVALGVVVTALVQSVIAGAALSLAGVPRAGLLIALLFISCIAQLGPIPILLPTIIWVFWSGSTFWGFALIAATIVVALVDNVLKPVLIRRGVNLPMLLIIAGVIGGIIGFGVVGLFIGPVLLAVTWTLLEAWVRADEPVAEAVTAVDGRLAEPIKSSAVRPSPLIR